MRELRTLNAGRVTFMPLNRLKRAGGALQYPERQDCVPMLRKLRFDEIYRPAIELVFRNALIVKDAAAGSQISRAFGFECLTIEGVCRPQHHRGAVVCPPSKADGSPRARYGSSPPPQRVPCVQDRPDIQRAVPSPQAIAQPRAAR